MMPSTLSLNQDAAAFRAPGANQRRRIAIAYWSKLTGAWIRWFFLCSLLALAGCGDSVNLQAGLTDADANEIVSLLNRYGIEAQKHPAKDGVTLKVKSTDVSRATDAMRASGLPRRSLSNLGQMFKKEGMISTPLEERVRYIHGLSQELEFTLQQFDNVISARVHVVLPERIAPGEPVQPSSAAVFIKHRLPFDEDAIVPRVRALVASSIPGLSGDAARSKVAITLAPSDSVVPDAVEWTTVGPFIVQGGSVGWLYMFFGMFFFLFLCVLGGVLKFYVFKDENTKASKLWKRYFGKAPPLDGPALRESLARTAEKLMGKAGNRKV